MKASALVLAYLLPLLIVVVTGPTATEVWQQMLIAVWLVYSAGIAIWIGAADPW